MFVEVIVERMKISRESQGAKRLGGEVTTEAETGSLRTAEDAAKLTPQSDNGEQKDAESKEDGSSQGKSEHRS